MVAGVVEHRDMVTAEVIPAEVRARVEANALFDALRTGDYTGAAQAQERLRLLGWYVSREPGRKRRSIPQKARRSQGGAV
jgi:hypothetical protein